MDMNEKKEFQQGAAYPQPPDCPQGTAAYPQAPQYQQGPAYQQAPPLQQGAAYPSGTTVFGSVNFKQGLCGCCSNCDSCCCSCCCPCIENGYIAEKVGENFFMFCCLHLLLPVFPIIYLRNKVREQRNIKGSIAEDVLIGCCCACCSISQCATELDIAIMR